MRAQPGAGLDENRALLLRPLMRGREPCRPKLLAAVMAGESADRDRNIRRPVARRAGRRNRLAGQRGHDGQAVDVRELTLVGRHAERGVALQMLDRAEALAFCQSDIVGRDVVLKINKSLVAAHVPERRDGECLIVHARRFLSGRCEARVLGRLPARFAAFAETIAQQHATVRCADRSQSGWRLPRHEGRQIRVPHRPATVVAGQAQLGIPPARDRERISFDPLSAAARLHGDRTQQGAGLGPADPRIGNDASVRTSRLQMLRHFGPAVDDRGDIHAASCAKPSRFASRHRCW